MEIILPDEHTWKLERKKGIGASEFGAVLGMSRFKTNVELWEEKVGLREAEDISEKSYVKYGHDAEPHLRALFALDHPELIMRYDSPYKIIRNDKYPFFQASPDGELIERATGRCGGFENKTTEIFSPAMWKQWDNQIPDDYYCQAIGQFIATDWEFVWLKAQIKSRKNNQLRIETREYKIERADAEEDIAYAMSAGIEFWGNVINKKRPHLMLPLI